MFFGAITLLGIAKDWLFGDQNKPKEASTTRSYKRYKVRSNCNYEPEEISADHIYKPGDVSSEHSYESDTDSSDYNYEPGKTAAEHNHKPDDARAEPSYESVEACTDYKYEPDQSSTEDSYKPEEVSSGHSYELEVDSTDYNYELDQISTENSYKPEKVSSSAQKPDPNVLYETTFNHGLQLLVCKGDIIKTKADVLANSVGPKTSSTANVLSFGDLAQQFGKAGGQGLVKHLASSKLGCFGYGEIRFTGAYDIANEDGSPQSVCHFCVPIEYNGEATYLKIESLFERALTISHDMGMRSVAFPLIGAGRNNYPPIEVMKAILDACSLFRQKDTQLKNIIIVVSENDFKNIETIEQHASLTLSAYTPMGDSYQEVLPQLSDDEYSDAGEAFLKTIGYERRAVVHKALPIEKGKALRKYKSALERVKAARPNLTPQQLETFAWHGTRGDYANLIVKSGFDLRKAGTSGGTKFGEGAYFGKYARTSHQYSIPGAHVPVGMKETLSTQQIREQQQMHTMLLCKIIVGKQQLGRKGMTQPNDGFDSARNGDGTYFVIFNSDHILPVAIIEYSVLRGSRG